MIETVFKAIESFIGSQVRSKKERTKRQFELVVDALYKEIKPVHLDQLDFMQHLQKDLSSGLDTQLIIENFMARRNVIQSDRHVAASRANVYAEDKSLSDCSEFLYAVRDYYDYNPMLRQSPHASAAIFSQLEALRNKSRAREQVVLDVQEVIDNLKERWTVLGREHARFVTLMC